MSFPTPGNELDRLAALRQLNILDTGAEKDFEDITKLAALLCGVPISLITLLDAKRQWFKSKVGVDIAETPRELAFCNYTILGKEPIIVMDMTADERFSQNPFVTGEANIRFYAAVPLVMKNGCALGSLCVLNIVSHQLDEAQMGALQILAAQVTKMLEARLQENALKSVNRQLKTSEERHYFLAESIPQQVWTAKPNGNLDYVNQRIVDYYGFVSAEEGLGMTWLTVIHPDDLNLFKRHWLRAKLTGIRLENEYRLRRADGEYRWHLAQAAALRDKNGAILKWYGTNTDIHDWKILEAEAREAEGYRNLFQHANDAILILDIDTEVVLDANEKACQMYDFKHEDFLGRSTREFTKDNANGDKHRIEMQREGSNLTFETVQFRADGTPLEIVINASVIEYQGRKVILSINRDVTERNRTDRLLVHNALHDALTKLPNRALFTEHLRHAIARRSRDKQATYAVLFLDFDGFKIINDSLGHAEGDNLLIMFAERLKASVRPGDVVARLGGDEFTVLLEEMKEPDNAPNIAARIHESLKAPFTLKRQEVFINASIGIALSSSAYTDPAALLRDADIAMYHAKAEGRGRTRLFNNSMHEKASARLRLENELRQAIERQEFCVYYQPIIDFGSSDIMGFEALVRWQHPVRGMVSPMDFIPIAEETGLILPLGEWVLRESCRQLVEWKTRHPERAELTISVNLSCKQFLQPNLAENVAQILRETGLSAKFLRLEVTESYLMEDSEQAIEIMQRLRELGICISIDDFGTGYSSLSYLHRLPIDYLKIDRSFVSGMSSSSEDREIVKTIITLAKNLSLKTIAEGIETFEQAQQVKDFGCDYAQGYLYSKPVEGARIFPDAVSQVLKNLQAKAHSSSP